MSLLLWRKYGVAVRLQGRYENWSQSAPSPEEAGWLVSIPHPQTWATFHYRPLIFRSTWMSPSPSNPCGGWRWIYWG